MQNLQLPICTQRSAAADECTEKESLGLMRNRGLYNASALSGSIGSLFQLVSLAATGGIVNI